MCIVYSHSQYGRTWQWSQKGWDVSNVPQEKRTCEPVMTQTISKQQVNIRLRDAFNFSDHLHQAVRGWGTGRTTPNGGLNHLEPNPKEPPWIQY